MAITLGTILADFTTSLATKLSVGGTSCSIQSNTDDDGVTLPDGSYHFTLDGDSSQKEYIYATKTGANLTDIKSVSRQGVVTTGAVREHRVGANAKITDHAVLFEIRQALLGTDTLPALLKYDTELTPSGQYDIVYKKWVEDRNGYWTGAVANFAALPIGTVEGEARVTLDDGKIYVWDIATATTATISSIDLGTNVITMTGNHGLSTGDYIYFATSGTLPAGLALNTAYYVYVDGAATLHVSLAIAGATVDITSAGTGTHTVKEASWVLAGAGGGAGTVYVTNKLGTGADDAPTNTTFTLTAGSWADQKYLQVYVNGVLQEYGATEDYTVADSNTVVFNTGVEDTDKVTLLVVSVDLYNPAWGLVNADILPDTHNTYDVGATGNRFKNGFFEGNVDIDGTLNVEGVATFQALPTIPLTPVATTDAASKGYVDTQVSTSMSSYQGTSMKCIASDNIKASDDVEFSTTNNELTLMAGQIRMYHSGVIRVKYDCKDSSGSNTFNIYRDSTAVGTSRTPGTSYVTYSEDITVSAGDAIGIYLTSTYAATKYVRNFRIYFDISTSTYSLT